MHPEDLSNIVESHLSVNDSKNNIVIYRMLNNEGNYVIIKTYSFEQDNGIYTYNVKINLKPKYIKLYIWWENVLRKFTRFQQ